MSKKKVIIIIVVVVSLVLLVGGYFSVSSVMKRVLYDPIENNSSGKAILTYRISLAKISHDKIEQSLKKYYPLMFKDGLYLENISQVSFRNSLRPLDSDGKIMVTVINAGRGIYTYPYQDPFLKMHVEQSTDQNFEKDKQTIVSYLESLANEESNRSDKFEKETYQDIEYYSVDNKAIKTGGTIGISEIFFPKEQMIVTIYFFNQNEGRESFKTIEEYKVLKTRFIHSMIDSATK